jgi:hypothetical protein
MKSGRMYITPLCNYQAVHTKRQALKFYHKVEEVEEV